LHISKNTFTFVGSFYKQKNGGSMGVSCPRGRLLFPERKADPVGREQKEKAGKQDCDSFSERMNVLCCKAGCFPYVAGENLKIYFTGC
jgi:hypothetical protein